MEKNFCSPYLSSKTFLLPSILFFPGMTFYSQKIVQKICWQNFLPKRICSSKTCSPKLPPKKISFKKNIVPHFAPLIFIQKNLLPKFFLPRICCQTFLLSIFLLTIKILLTKIPPKYFCWRNFLLTRTWSPKFPPKKICFKKKLLPILPPPLPPPPPPPPPKFSFKRTCSPNISSQKFAAKHFCSQYYFSQKIPSQILLPKNLCCPNHFVEQLWNLINTGAVAGYSAVPAALLLNFCHLLKKIVILLRVGEQKKHPDLQYVQSIFLVHS